MKLWLLRPVGYDSANEDPTHNPRMDDAWRPWYDKAFGFVVRAETEAEARVFAQVQAGDEGTTWKGAEKIVVSVWTDARLSTCLPLADDGDTGVVLRDFASA